MTCRDANRADLQCFFIHTEVNLTPKALLWPTMFACVSLTFAFRFDPGRIDEQMQRPRPAAIRNDDVERLLTAAQGAEIWGCPESSPAHRRRLSTNPVVCRRGMPNSTFIVRQTWIASSLNSGGRPRFPAGAACHDISGSNPIDSEPRCFSAVLYNRQFFVLYFVGDPLLIAASDHSRFKQ